MTNYLILTPLAVELASLSATPLAKRSDVHLAVGGHGKVQFALSTQLLIQKFQPRLVICAGGAGSLDPDLRNFDVVVAERTLEHDFKLRFIERPLPEFPGDLPTLETLKRRVESDAFAVHFGTIASGDEDIVDATRASELRKSTGAMAVAWEGAGAARACRLQGVPFIEIRAITDSANGTAAREFTENIKLGMKNVASVIEALLP